MPMKTKSSRPERWRTTGGIEGAKNLTSSSKIQDKDAAPPSASWKSLFSFTTRKHIVMLVLALVFTVMTSIIMPTFAILLGSLFDSFTNFGSGRISESQFFEAASKGCLTLFGLGFASWISNGIYFTTWIIFGELQSRSLHRKFFSELLNKDLAWFETKDGGSGAFISRMQTHIRDLQMAISQPLGIAIQHSIQALMGLGLAFYTSWKLTLVTLAAAPPCLAIVSNLSSRMQSSIVAEASELDNASSLAHEAIAAIDTVKCFNGQSSTCRKYTLFTSRATLHFLQQGRLDSCRIALTRFMVFVMFAQGFWYGSSLVESRSLSTGAVLKAFWACLIAMESIQQMLPQIFVLDKGKVAGASLEAILYSRPAEILRKRTNTRPLLCKGDIKVNRVSFAYPSQPGKLVLKSTSLFFPAGKTTFIIGRSGSGKSTLADLLLQFYSPIAGEILIDDISIEMLETGWIRNNVTLVQQQSILFNETIFQNLAFGSRNSNFVTKKSLQACIDMANLHDLVDKMPDGLDTMVGIGGDLLSGGQKQRVAIARAILRDTPILILDECTSALDSENRGAVMRSIRKWREGKTTIIITHDISQIPDNDFVYVLERGKVIESGWKNRMKEMGMLDSFLQPPHSNNVRSPSVTQLPSGLEAATHDQICVPMPSTPSSSEQRRPQYRNSINTMSIIHSPRLPAEAYTPPIRKGGLAHVKPKELHNKRLSEASLESCPQQSSLPTLGPNNLERGSATNFTLHKKHPISLHRILFTVFPSLAPRHRFYLISGLLCALVHSASTSVFAYFLAELLETYYIAENRSQMAKTWSLTLFSVAIGDAMLFYLMYYLLEYCGQAWIDSLRSEALKRILDQPRSWFDREENNHHILTLCLNGNPEEMRNIVSKFAGLILVAVNIVIIALVWSSIICWRLALVGILCGTIMYNVTRRFEDTSGRWERRCNSINESVFSISAETFSNIRTVRALTLEPYFFAKHVRALKKARTAGLKRAAYSGFFFGLAVSAIIFVSALVFYVGAMLVTMAQATVKDIITVSSILLFSAGYASAVLSSVSQISLSRDAATRLLRLSNLPLGASHEHHGKTRVFESTPVQFTGLHFNYPCRPEAPVLHDFSLTVPPNSCTAIVGPSGSGKSTISSLLLRIYSPLSPRFQNRFPPIALGGLDIRDLHTPTIRSLISLVPQQPRLFTDSIRNNISYGLDPFSPLNTLQNIRAAAQATGIDEFICSLPDGYSTIVGEGGIGLSGGQAQRLAITRALVRRPQVIILDEATSNLDPESAGAIRRSVCRLVAAKQGPTVIIITHATGMMEIADNVVVMEQGSVVEEGPYHTLIKRTGGRLRTMLATGDVLGE